MLVPGQRTMATTYSPGFTSVTFSATSTTWPKLSCPSTRKLYPGGAAPYSAALISLSVPSTPTRRTRTSTPLPLGTDLISGFSRSARCALLALPGMTATAFTVLFSLARFCRCCCDSRACWLFHEEFVNHLGHQRGPAGLVAGADPRARVAMKVLVEWDVVAPVRVGLEGFIGPKDRTPAVRAALKSSDQTP